MRQSLTVEQIRSFWVRVQIVGECWEWTGCILADGYGQVSFNGRRHRTHRLAYQLAHDIDDLGEEWVLHHCDNRACVRPDHLFRGDVQANHDDMDEKGRRAIGVRHGSAKLTPEEVKEIRDRSDELLAVLAEEYDVSEHTISVVRRRKAWRHVP